MTEPQHLPHCKPVQVTFIGHGSTPHAGWQCVAECPVYRARIAGQMTVIQTGTSSIARGASIRLDGQS